MLSGSPTERKAPGPGIPADVLTTKACLYTSVTSKRRYQANCITMKTLPPNAGGVPG